MQHKNSLEGFLSKGIDLTKLSGFNDTEVRGLENLPPAITERFPDGFVLKKIAETPLTNPACPKDLRDAQRMYVWPDSKLSDDEVLEEIRKHNAFEYFGLTNDDSLHEQVSCLRRKPPYLERLRDYFAHREDELIDFFADELPHLIVRGDFIIGKQDANAEAWVYEIQPRLRGYFDLSGSLFAREELKGEQNISFYSTEEENIRGIAYSLRQYYSDDQIKTLCSQLEIFVRKARQYVKEKGYVFDFFAADNLIVSKDGELRMIDTNLDFHIKTAQVEDRYRKLRPMKGPQFSNLPPDDRDFIAVYEDYYFDKDAVPSCLEGIEKLITNLRQSFNDSKP